MPAEFLPEYNVSDFNAALGNLLERGFAPRFILTGSVSKSQNKKGHQWLTLTDGKAFINAVIWSSTLNKISYTPNLDDGIQVIGKLNFWSNRATISVQVLNIRPTISTVLRKFEMVKLKLESEGLIKQVRHRELPRYPKAIAILTSVPSSAFADIERTAKERWPLTRLVVIPISVQGAVEKLILSTLLHLKTYYKEYDIEAIILARGGGSREDLIPFDDEKICRVIADYPVPVVTGLGHEDDMTVADLVADFRASTPTAAIVSLLPSRQEALGQCMEKRNRLKDYINWLILLNFKLLKDRSDCLENNNLYQYMKVQKQKLENKGKLLNAYSPEKILARGFSILTDSLGRSITTIKSISVKDSLTIHLIDGQIESSVKSIQPQKGLSK